MGPKLDDRREAPPYPKAIILLVQRSALIFIRVKFD